VSSTTSRSPSFTTSLNDFGVDVSVEERGAEALFIVAREVERRAVHEGHAGGHFP
jgi:hypothetical protein